MRFGLIIVFIIPFSLAAQSVTIKGVVRDVEKDELPLAHIIVLPDSITEVSDTRGRFSVSTRAGTKQFIISYTGYETQHLLMQVSRDTTIIILLRPKINQLDEVVVRSKRDLQTDVFESTRSGTNVLTPEDVSAIPVLGGEADLIKVLQLMPGTVRGIEGSADLFVRGGAADQNLVLLDDATIYSTSHLFGFVSVFNSDILETVESINGGFPANYGGRLSSILNVKTNSKLAEATHVSGNIGLIASRLYVEQPIIKDKVSLWVAGRRTYIDQVAKLVNIDLPYFFYDVNAKLLVQPTSRDHLAVSYYSGEDIFEIFGDRNNDGDGFLSSYRSGNNSQSIQWTRKLPNSWYGTATALRTAYQYDIQNSFRDNRLLAFSDIEDVSGKIHFGNNDLTNKGSIKLGVDWIYHKVSPSVISSNGIISEFLSSSASPGRTANELAMFILYEWQLTDRWIINTGLRSSMALVKNKTYMFPEPRASVRYALSDKEALKFSYARMAQYMHRISNSAITSPTDIWYPITDVIQPQTSHQFSVAWQRTIPKTKIFMSTELYYKPMRNLIGFEEGTNLFFNADFEPKLVQGKGRAYGLEVLLRKEAGKFTGWISYTLSWSRRQFDAINNSFWFPSRYDRRHNGAIVMQYSPYKRLSFSLVWEFISGSRFTPIIGQYVVLSPSSTGVNLLPVYAPINSVKLANSHRLDLGIKFRSKQDRKFRYEWFAGVYNVYNRANPVGITIETNQDGSMRYEQPGLFGLIPFISYGFKF